MLLLSFLGFFNIVLTELDFFLFLRTTKIRLSTVIEGHKLSLLLFILAITYILIDNYLSLFILKLLLLIPFPLLCGRSILLSLISLFQLSTFSLLRAINFHSIYFYYLLQDIERTTTIAIVIIVMAISIERSILKAKQEQCFRD